MKAFFISALIIFSMICIGRIYRHYRTGGEDIAVTFIGTALLITFSNFGAVANYLLLGVAGQPIDLYLAKMDLVIGFHWPTFMIEMQNFPLLSSILAFAYNISLLLVILVLLVLGFSGKHDQLYKFIFTLVIAATITIGFWTFFPSFGTTAIYTITPETQALVNPVVGNDYGNILRSLNANQIPLITPLNIQGIVAFPSYHTIMALVCIYYGWSLVGWKYLFLITNILVIMAVPIHGGHHLVDLLGAFVVTCAVIYVVENLNLNSESSVSGNLGRPNNS